MFPASGPGCDINSHTCPSAVLLNVSVGLSMGSSPEATLCHCTPPWTAAQYGAPVAVRLSDQATYGLVPVTLTTQSKTITLDVLVLHTTTGWVVVETFCGGNPGTAIVNGSGAAC